MNSKMTPIEQLSAKIAGQGWFGGTLRMNILVENTFEGFWGRASESWEHRITIEITSPEDCKLPSLKVVGGRTDSINDVAKKVLQELEKHKQQ